MPSLSTPLGFAAAALVLLSACTADAPTPTEAAGRIAGRVGASRCHPVGEKE